MGAVAAVAAILLSGALLRPACAQSLTAGAAEALARLTVDLPAEVAGTESVRRPLEEITAFFEWLKLVEFTSATNEALTAAALSSEMEKLGPNMFRPEDQVRALSRTLKEYRTRITELAKKTE